MCATKFPDVTVELSDEDGNVFNLIGKCRRVAKKAGVPREEIERFSEEVMGSGSYDEALGIMMKWFDVV